MCGITGFFDPQGPSDAHIRAMTDQLVHRGPDDSGILVENGIALGQRRLSIIDLSPLGHQPMESGCGRYVTVFNGEVYNFGQLRKELEPLGHTFRGGSDTEVILGAIAQWGVRAAVNRFIGMFAIALWDRKERTLTLVRDRLGIKPVYYGMAGRAFVFGSELKALRAHPDFSATINRDALALYFRHNYIPAPYSIYENISKLEPGCILTLDCKDESLHKPHVEKYWSVEDVYTNGLANIWTGTELDAVNELEDILSDAISLRMIADVPLGAFLSGGIDSSTVVALMQKQSSRPVKTFSIGFKEGSYNEAEHARAVAEHLGTEHTELYVSPQDLLDVVPLIPHHWDEPFADSSQIPTYVVSKLARQHVTVSLSGDGGDELFGGYSRYFWTMKVRRLLQVPGVLRQLAAKFGKALPTALWKLAGPKGDRVKWRLDLLGARDFAEIYLFLISHFKKPTELVLGSAEPPTPLTRKWPDVGEDFRRMQAWDLESYLPDDILTKVDRASMAVSLEARVPILDHRVVEFSARLPHDMKVKNGNGKHLLRQVLYRHVPQELIDRPKMGFGVPIEHWLKNELRDWAEDLLNEQNMAAQGYLDAGAVRKMWTEYQQGQGNWYYYLWDVLMFQAWLAHSRP